MKTKKISLKEVGDVLSRAEMKKIMSGSGYSCSAVCGDHSIGVSDCAYSCTATDGWGVSCSSYTGTSIERC